MIYECRVHTNTNEIRKIKVLMDTGASACFMTAKMASILKLGLTNSTIKAVATAAGKRTSLMGMCRFQLRIPVREKSRMDASETGENGRIRPDPYDIITEVTAHTLTGDGSRNLIPGVQLILGQDFMKRYGVSIRYGPNRCSLSNPEGKEVEPDEGTPPDIQHLRDSPVDGAVHSRAQGTALPTSPSRESTSPGGGTEDHPRFKDPAAGMISAATAVRLLRKDHSRAFVALIQPHPMSTGTEDPNLSQVPPHMLADLRNLLHEFAEVFSESPQAGGALVDTLEHTIDLMPGSKPPFRRNFRLSPLEMAELRKQVTEFLDKGIITPSNSPFGAPVLFVPKPGGGLRFCLDYRALNAITIKTRYQLPRIDDLLDAARGATYFSALDLASGYYQLRIAEGDCHKTAFATPFGHYEWRVLPMGLTNAPTSFMRTMQGVLSDLIGKSALIYIDDILVMSRTAEAHIPALREVLARFRTHNFKVKLSKCKFFQTQVKFLGHILSADGIRADPGKINTLHEWEFPKNGTGMLQFLGLANYFRKFIPNFSRLSAPLYHLTKKGVPFYESEEALRCFSAIKHLLISPPVLAYPDPEKPYEVISDASLTGCGAVLTQEGKPIAYFSSRFSSAERNYTTGEQEMLGIIKALKEWRCYLEGCKGLTLVTDHNPLTFFSVQPNLSRRQARWSEFLSRFHFEVKYRPGASNPADSLSRLYETNAPDPGPALTAMLLALTANEYKPDLMAKIREATAADPRFADPEITKDYTKEDGFWTSYGRIVIPESLQPEIIREHHATASAGHFSWSQTLDLLTRHFWWPKMRDSV